MWSLSFSKSLIVLCSPFSRWWEVMKRLRADTEWGRWRRPCDLGLAYYWSDDLSKGGSCDSGLGWTMVDWNYGKGNCGVGEGNCTSFQKLSISLCAAWGASGVKLPSAGLWLNASHSESFPVGRIQQHSKALAWPHRVGPRLAPLLEQGSGVETPSSQETGHSWKGGCPLAHNIKQFVEDLVLNHLKTYFWVGNLYLKTSSLTAIYWKSVLNI